VFKALAAEKKGRPGTFDAAAVHAVNPTAVVVSITPFGQDGPWCDRAATEFTLQAWCGSTGFRGVPERPPVAAGGRIGEWVAGTYAAVAAFDLGRSAMYAASVCESLTGGLGTAAFLAFLMHICDKRRAATEYALLSAIFGLTRSLAGSFSGWGAEHLGFASYFALTFVLAFPAFGLLPWVKPWTEANGSNQSSAN